MKLQQGNRKQLSIKIIMAVMIGVGLVVPTVVSTGWMVFSNYQKEEALYRQEAEQIATILALGAQEAIWNFDAEILEPLLDAFAKDQRLAKVEFFRKGGKLFKRLERSEEVTKELSGYGAIAMEKKIYKDNEYIGTVNLELSLKKLQKELQSQIFTTIGSMLAQLLFCLMIISLLLDRIVVKKILKLENQAEMMAKKKLDEPFDWEDNNEIGNLGRSLETTRKSLKNMIDNLEEIVQDRTNTIKTIIDNVKSGFFLIDGKLEICEGFTKSCQTLLEGRIKIGSPITEVLGLSGRDSSHFDSCLAQVFDDIFPEEVSFSQVPDRIRLSDKVLSVEGAAVRNREGEVVNILITVNDITLLEEAERQNCFNQAIIRIITHRDSFAKYVKDTRNMISTAQHDVKNRPKVKSTLHTIKGNSAAFGLDDLSSLIHNTEEKEEIKINDLVTIENCLKDFLNQNYDILKVAYDQDRHDNRFFEVSDAHLHILRDKIIQQSPISEEVRRDILVWMWEIKKRPAAKVFSTIPELVKSLSKKLFKRVCFKMDGSDTLVDPDRLDQFVLVLPHVIRNAVDHGIESPTSRVGKDPVGTIKLSVQDMNDKFWRIEVSDDGQGIDTDKLARKAIEKGIVTQAQVDEMSYQKKCDLIFHEEISTAEEVTEISGRGIGMEAVKKCVEALDGRIDIESKQGVGTKVTFVLAKEPAGPGVEARKAG